MNIKHKHKVLILGIGQSNFLDQLYGDIILNNTSFSFYIDGYKDLSKKKDVSSIYTKHYNFDSTELKSIDKIEFFLKLLFESFFWNMFFFEIKNFKNFKKFITTINKHLRAKFIAEKKILPLNFDIYHFHFCVPDNIIYLHYLKKKKSICSFWGSDLLRDNTKENIYYVSNALKKTTKITIQTNELAKKIKNKYPVSINNKISTLRFTLSLDIFHSIDSCKDDKSLVDKFKETHNIPFDNIIISVGHNGFKENNHFEILNSLQNLSISLRKRITVIMHLSYGGQGSYLNKLYKYSKKSEHFQVVTFIKFLSIKDLGILRTVSDIFIHMPQTDALSAAMTEVIYAGNIAVTGSWLPYSFFKSCNIKYYEVSNYFELENQIIFLIENLKELKSQNKNNRNLIKNYFFPEVTTPEWISVLNQTLNV